MNNFSVIGKQYLRSQRNGGNFSYEIQIVPVYLCGNAVYGDTGAAGQCGRGVVPALLPTTELKDFGHRFADYDLVLFFYELGGAPLGETMWDNDKAKKIAVITGPEGGFTAQEAEMLGQKGAKTISLGKRILRAETAPLAALTGIMLLTDNLE